MQQHDDYLFLIKDKETPLEDTLTLLSLILYEAQYCKNI